MAFIQNLGFFFKLRICFCVQFKLLHYRCVVYRLQISMRLTVKINKKALLTEDEQGSKSFKLNL
jgi:hypothetical protein